MLEKRPIHIPDVLADPEYRWHGDEGQRIGNYRTILGVPLMRDDIPFGSFSLLRRTVRPFTSKEIELVASFADQAVIAIENTRLFEAEQASKRALQESLEYQTAISDVLDVISRSRFELQPVLDKIVETAARLGKADKTALRRWNGMTYPVIASYGFSDDEGAYIRTANPSWPAESIMGRMIAKKRAVHEPDIAKANWPGWPNWTLMGVQSGLGVPLLRDEELLGTLALWRTQQEPFSAAQIELVETFADQAVIAIENTRLFEAEQANKRELQESLEYQTATSEVLNIVSRSPAQIETVMDAIAEVAARVCRPCHAGVLMLDGDMLRAAAKPQGVLLPSAPMGMALHERTVACRAFLEKRTIHVEDITKALEEYPDARRFVASSGHRTTLAIPLLREGTALGIILLRRPEVKPFRVAEIRLLETFADQAVIAIENTRLFEEVQARTKELTESLESQTATSDILNVISRSPTDVQPVFDTIAANAVKLCSATFSVVLRFDGEVIEIASLHNVRNVEGIEALRRAFPRRPLPGGATDDAILTRTIRHIPDVLDDRPYPHQPLAQATSYRSILSVPMLRHGTPVGVITVAGASPRMFTERHVNLLTIFAEQAVIALENTRLFEEVQARNRDLTALGEVGRAVSSTLDLNVVLKTIVDRAVELSGTDGGSIFYYRGGRFELGETTGLDEESIAGFRKLDIAEGQTGLGEAIAQRRPLQVPDILNRPSNPLRDAAIEAGFRAALIVPLLGSEGPRGALVLQRRKPGEFMPAVVSLMQALPTSRPSRSKTPACSMRSLGRAASLRLPASTSRSSSPT